MAWAWVVRAWVAMALEWLEFGEFSSISSSRLNAAFQSIVRASSWDKALATSTSPYFL
eukprot:CAMPEP_0167805332 /NCGR_PEP_ID=MMETSP0111_2-20121227/21114_1 /TAXON_ID=91324 /ORGANISM="Lotharella globosa, Strain CCCM811" /LENGTH=57 /DNA_ID=CAMNT_0007702463 /DNA_START=471 /DNA_END=643 /DNA_ORIENTATION=+